jgi:O-antigen/teichoic acid export membrane protein
MSRLKNFSRNLATSYLQLGVNVIYSLVSVPLILHWLPKTEFGLWVLLVQIMGYMALVDLGMTAAVSRLLVDHKDERANGNYGSLLQTAALVSLAQAAIIFLLVMLAAPLLAGLMKIPAEHEKVFILLLRMQGIITAFNFLFRPFSLMLYAHQRMDVQACNDMLNLLGSLGLLVLFLTRGGGISAFIYANAIMAVCSPFFLFWNCRRLGFLPRAGEWGRISRQIFREALNYGTSVFFFNLGSQMLMASQTIVVSRALGFESAAVWSIGSKMFNLAVPLVCRPNGAALPGLYEMQARGELERLKKRFQSVVLLTASLGAFLGVSLALCNSLFVTVWTAGKINWLPLNDVLLGIWLLVISLTTTHLCFVNVTKQIGGMRYILFAEGCTFIVLASWIGCRWGTSGMILTSILCCLAFSYQYSLRRSCGFFQCRWRELALDWVRPCLNLAAVYSGLAIIVWFATNGLPVTWRLAIHGVVAGVIGGALFLRLGFPREMLREASGRLPSSMIWLAQFIAP